MWATFRTSLGREGDEVAALPEVLGLGEVSGGRLEVRHLSKAYYGLLALSDVSFVVEPGELVGLIGPNGSGKTTAIDCISGFLAPNAGEVRFDERSLAGRRPDECARRGLVRTFQAVRVFRSMSARTNVLMGMLAADGRGHARRTIGHGSDEVASSLLADLGLAQAADKVAGDLAYGQRKLVELAAALIARPRLLLLDEPVAGVNAAIARVIRDHVVALNQAGTSIILVEHNLEFVANVCPRVIVLDHGQLIADGPPSSVMHLPVVHKAYFGR